MSRQELTCQHGVGHSGGIHGCDGCCSIIADAVEQRIIKLLEDEDCHCSADKDDSPCTKHYLLIALIKGEQMSENGRNKDYYAGKQAGVFQERSRIIKLLETEATKESDYCTLPIDPEHCSMCWHYDLLIALINGDGENK